MLLGDGLLTKTKDAANNWEVAQKEEINRIDEMDQIINQYGNNEEKLNNNKKYDVITTDDGMWEIYKDIDTKTTKVNVYVTSKYYYPSFEQYVLEQFYLRTFLLGCALPIYDFSDLEDYYWNYMEWLNMENEEEIMALWNKPYPNSTFSEMIERLGIKEYELYTEVGSEIVDAMKNNLNFNKGAIAIGDTTDFPILNKNINEYGLNLNELLKSYNELYGEKIKLEVSENDKNKTYQIIFPNGQEKSIMGSELTHARFRYAALENGDIQIRISNGTDEKTIDYKNVTNIENCLYEEGDYIYTYNCLPFLFEETYTEGSMARCMLYRFDFGGWNVTNRYLLDKHYVGEDHSSLNAEDFPQLAHTDKIENYTVSGKILNKVLDEPVTSMFGTYVGATIMDKNIEIPEGIVYMFYTFSSLGLQEGETVFIPDSVKYTCYAIPKSCYSDGKWIPISWNYKHSFYSGKEFDGPWEYIKPKND